MTTSSKRRASLFINYRTMLKKFTKTVALFVGLAVAVAMPISNTFNAEADGVAEIAMELTSGTVFHEKNADRRLPMASTTKIMTALIISEDCDLSEVITVPDQAVGVEGSSIYLKHGEELSVKDLLYGLMLRSGNDAACALAIHHSGSVDKFVEEMNGRAAEIGATDTHFCNPSGLPDPDHYTTARDLCNIARCAMSNEVFSNVVSTKFYEGDFRRFVNKNKLLSTLDGANGVKTGYTERAGRCLVSSAKRENMDVVCVVLNCYDMFERSQLIIESCFDKYATEIISADTLFNFNGRNLCLGEDCRLITEREAELEYKITDSQDRSAAAKLEIYCQNNLIFSHNLYTINNVK